MDFTEALASTVSAKNQMAFQERMSNTAHQRETQDLIKAGLNPVLSAHSQGASTPSGASGDFSGALGSLVGSLNNAVDTTGKALNSAIGKLGDVSFVKDIIDGIKGANANSAIANWTDENYEGIIKYVRDPVLRAFLSLGKSAIDYGASEEGNPFTNAKNVEMAKTTGTYNPNINRTYERNNSNNGKLKNFLNRMDNLLSRGSSY